MKNYYHWLTPLLVSSLIVGIVWFVADPETFIYYPRTHPTDGLFSFLAVTAVSYIMYSVYLIAIRYFTGKNNRIKTGFEYAIIFSFIILSIAVVSIFITYVINHKSFSLPEIIRNCGLTSPVAFIHYLALRNSRMTDEYNRQTLQLEKIRSNQLETELKYLRAQYHPHFLFNALNTVYFQIDDQSVNAKNTVEILSELLRYQLYNIEKKVDIADEIYFIKSYIRFQQLRMTNRLAMNIRFDDELSKQKIYPLIYQPFLENALKYVGGEYRINMEMKLFDNKIIFRLENSLPDRMQQTIKSNAGIGIENAQRRLALLYPNRHQLNIKQNEKSFMVELIINSDSDED